VMLLAVLAPYAATVAHVQPASAAVSGCTPYAFNNLAPGGSSIAYQNCTNVVQLTSQSAASAIGDDEPSVAPNGRSVAFRRSSGDISEVYTTSTTPGGPAFQVTHFGGHAAAPSWSPDSTQLVVEVLLPDAPAASIYKINVDGSGAVLLKTGAHAQHPSWCRNGRIAYSSQAGASATREIHTFNASDGGDEATLTTGSADSDPAWSPNCEWVFYDSAQLSSLNSTQIRVVPATGGQPTTLTNGDLDLNPSLSNDWTLAFARVASNGNPQIYFQDLSGSKALGQPSTSTHDYWPSFKAGDGSIPPPTAFPISVGEGGCPALQTLRGAWLAWQFPGHGDQRFKDGQHLCGNDGHCNGIPVRTDRI
jgi:Tol biopolymer transport system component